MAANPQQSHNDLLSYFENAKSNCLLILDKMGVVLDFNQAFTENFGYSKEDLVGRNFEILFNEADRKNKKPQIEIQSVLVNGFGSDNNYLIAKNGNQLWIAGESILMQKNSGIEFIIKLVQNIQTHKIAELNYIELNEFNEGILSTIDDAVLVLDRKNKLSRYNKSFELLLSSVKKPHSYQDILRYLIAIDPEGEIKRKIKQTSKSGIFFKNLQINVPDPVNGDMEFIVSGYKLAQTDKQDRILIMFHNITPLKKLENEREDLMAFVAHELRSPLASLALSNELLENYLERNQTDNAKLILNNARKNVQRLNKMVAELNFSSIIHGGSMQLEKTHFNFTEMVKEVCVTMKSLYPAINITYTEKKDIQIEGDKFRLIEVVTNYLNNAIKYTEHNKKITIQSIIKDKNLVFSLKDNGMGISKEEIPFIFKRFFRAERTKNLEGIGLGLYLCEKIIRAHSGKVWVESELGKGSKFYFSIPTGK